MECVHLSVIHTISIINIFQKCNLQVIMPILCPVKEHAVDSRKLVLLRIHTRHPAKVDSIAGYRVAIPKISGVLAGQNKILIYINCTSNKSPYEVDRPLKKYRCYISYLVNNYCQIVIKSRCTLM